jgi:NADPH:quinone reductase-like Zn-dependent oxidoreductase
MKAIVYKEYGDPSVLHVEECAKPTPKPNEVLVKVMATSVNYGDLLARKIKYVSRDEFNMLGIFLLLAKVSFGLEKPRINILGSEFSGIVESVGEKVTRFKSGNHVFGYLGQSMGAYAQYITIPETGVLANKPNAISFEEAAVISYGAIMALPLLRKMKVGPGQKILINGASGSIGSAAVQLAKSLGAEVTGVCSTQRVDYVKSLGADVVIDYSSEDFSKNGQRYDLIVDVLGKVSFNQCKNSLTRTGKVLYVSFKTGKLIQSMFNRKMVCAIAPGSVGDLLAVKELIEAGKLRAMIDRSFLLEQATEAHAYAESNAKKGCVSLTCN